MHELKTESYREIREFLDLVPVVETHEHYAGADLVVTATNQGIVATDSSTNVSFPHAFGYYQSDLQSAAYGREREITAMLFDPAMVFEERYRLFSEIRSRCDKTAYARAMMSGLMECYGIEEISEKTMRILESKLAQRNGARFDLLMNKYGIKAAVVDIALVDVFIDIVERRVTNYPRQCRFALPLLAFHDIRRLADLDRVRAFAGGEIACLEDYLHAFENLLERAVHFGIVCMKDPSAYRRSLCFGDPPKSRAENAFSGLLSDPNAVLGPEGGSDLEDWLFNQFMRLAAKHGLPVQVHTGHMDGMRNDVRKANAANLIPVLERHPDVRFDLFHGNWPYMDDFLFIGKNYPNAFLDLCWVHSIDPIYCVELMKRAVMTVPQSKVMAFGGDTHSIELTVGYLILARDNTAIAMSELVENGWLTIDEAKEISADWFYNNPNEFFGLRLSPFRP